MQRRETVDLLECRNKLDVIDKKIVKLFEERMDKKYPDECDD